eukprot:596898-Pelagomonas_calceolata.AAC.1
MASYEVCQVLHVGVQRSRSQEVSEEHAVRPYMAAQQRIKEFVHEHDLRNRLHSDLAASGESLRCMAFRLGCTRAKCG